MPRKKSEKTEEKTAEKAEKKESKTEEKKVEANVEEKIVELAKKGISPEKIGLELKKQGLFVKKTLGKRITEVLKSRGIEMNADLLNLQRNVETLKKHISINKLDFKAKRALLIKEANLNKLKKINTEQKR